MSGLVYGDLFGSLSFASVLFVDTKKMKVLAGTPAGLKEFGNCPSALDESPL